MEADTRQKRAQFIENCINIRETFGFAFPKQMLQAVKIHALHCYGAMLWDFESNTTGMFCRSWNTNVKLCYKVPRETHTYIVENCLASEYNPVIQEIYSRYTNFLKNLTKSVSSEVQHLFNVIKHDVQSTTAIIKKTGMNPCEISSLNMRSLWLTAPIPEYENWRIALLSKLLERRAELAGLLFDTEEISGQIDSLCKT